MLEVAKRGHTLTLICVVQFRNVVDASPTCFTCSMPCLLPMRLRSEGGQWVSEPDMRDKLKLSEQRLRAVKKFCMKMQLWKFDKYEAHDHEELSSAFRRKQTQLKYK